MALTERPAIRLRPKFGRRVRAGAPWAFSNEIVMDAATKALAPGTLVRLAREDGTFLGTGYFNAKSLIAVRLLSADANAEIGTEFFTAKLKQALSLRQALFDQPYYRLVHAEGDGLPGLIIDRFGKTLVAQVTTAGMEQLIEPILTALDEVVTPEEAVLRNDAPVRALEGLENYVRVAKGQAPARITVDENGARYFADIKAGQKSGWYYDQRENRAFIAKLARGRRLLDAYCYTGGFGILAARAGAREVAGLDSSEPALALASQAAAANGVDAACKFVKADVFEELERLAAAGERFGIVICDPPPFVRARKDLEPGAKAYRKLARLAASVTAPGGFLMLCSCSHNIPLERFMTECAGGIARGNRTAALIRSAGAGPDHPVHPLLPESAYLKALTYRLD
jgi:23S rRNA (cytosine1962-C5)-methyltransferase